jgi:hypothetical protein
MICKFGIFIELLNMLTFLKAHKYVDKKRMTIIPKNKTTFLSTKIMLDNVHNINNLLKFVFMKLTVFLITASEIIKTLEPLLLQRSVEFQKCLLEKQTLICG